MRNPHECSTTADFTKKTQKGTITDIDLFVKKNTSVVCETQMLVLCVHWPLCVH